MLDGWITRGKYVLEESRAHEGRWALCVNQQGDVLQRVAVVGGRLYTFSHYTRSDTSGQLAGLQISWLDSDGRQIDASKEVVPVGEAWKWNRMAISAPEGTSAAEVCLSVNKESTVCLDDIWFGLGNQTSP